MVRVDTTWAKMISAPLSMEKGSTLAFGIAKPGVIWVDDVALVLA